MNKPTKCPFCKKVIMDRKSKRYVEKYWRLYDTIHVKCSDWLDVICHKYCWKGLNIDSYDNTCVNK